MRYVNYHFFIAFVDQLYSHYKLGLFDPDTLQTRPLKQQLLLTVAGR